MVVYCLCMRAVPLKKIPVILLSLAVALVLLVSSLAHTRAATQCTPALVASCPYFVTKGSDIFTGGWFNQAAIACNGPSLIANYQSPQNTNPPIVSAANKGYFGGVLAYTDISGSRTGAASDLGAFSLGNIEADQTATSLYGFYTGLAGAAPITNGTRSLSFANQGAGINSTTNWGGLFEGGFLQSNCIPDYYNNPKNGAKTPLGSGYTINQLALDGASGNYAVAGNATLTGGMVPANSAGKGIAYFVAGDLTISGDVFYAPHMASTSPKFALVVQGNIYIDPVVKNLAGWYIAQPSPVGSTSKGTIWTCVTSGDITGGDPNMATGLTDTWMRAHCGPPVSGPLTINGALTAKQVNLGRIDASGTPLPLTSSETVNYIPEMAIGGGFFNQPPSTTAPIQSLISLPPVF